MENFNQWIGWANDAGIGTTGEVFIADGQLGDGDSLPNPLLLQLNTFVEANASAPLLYQQSNPVPQGWQSGPGGARGLDTAVSQLSQWYEPVRFDGAIVRNFSPLALPVPAAAWLFGTSLLALGALRRADSKPV